MAVQHRTRAMLERIPSNLKAKFETVMLSAPDPEAPACIACNDEGAIIVRGRGAIICGCGRQRFIEKRKAELLAKIPLRYRTASLEEMAADPNRHRDQWQVVEHVQKHPDVSLLLCGAYGCGKTHILWALYRHAVESGRPAMLLTVPDFLDQCCDYETGLITEAPIDFAGILSNTERWFIGLDDATMSRVSRYGSETIWRVVNAAYNHGHQLGVTTNKRKEAFQQHWSQVDLDYGRSITRRLLDRDPGEMARKDLF